MITKEEFNTLKDRGFNVIPIVKEISLTNASPLSVFNTFLRTKNSFLLESVEGGNKWAHLFPPSTDSKRKEFFVLRKVLKTDNGEAFVRDISFTIGITLKPLSLRVLNSSFVIILFVSLLQYHHDLFHFF